MMVFKKILATILIPLCIGFGVETVSAYRGRNNACPDFDDYYTIDSNPNCSYFPDIFMDTPRLIRRYIGVCETHKITTDDGYILTMFRIPRKNPKKVVLLSHPITADSFTFVSQGNDSLAFSLWRAGYDVWLNNHRGTPASLRHVNLSATHDLKYWDYSFEEIAVYEIPKELSLIRSKTGNVPITFLGHSMGTTVGLLYSSVYPEEAAEWIETFVFVCPPFFFKDTTSFLVYLAFFESPIKAFMDRNEIGNFFFYGKENLDSISEDLFRRFPVLLRDFNWMLSGAYGWAPEEMDPMLHNVNFLRGIRDFSWKAMCHFLQLMNVGTRFQRYDYGADVNRRVYGTTLPPEYPIEKNRVPIISMHAQKDNVVSKHNIERLYRHLPVNITRNGEIIEIPDLSHIQIYYGKNNLERFTKPLLKILGSL